MKRLMRYLCAALILVLTAVNAAAEVKFSTVFQYRTAIQPVQGTGFLIVESKVDNARGLYTTDGQEVIPCSAKYLDYISNGFFITYDDKEAIDGKTLWKADGRRIGTGYGAFIVFSNQWAAAFVINPQEVSDGEKDIKIDSRNYQYERIDLFYVTDDTGDEVKPVASLGRDAYAEAAIHGEYIAVANREKSVSLYDSSFQPVSVKLNAVKNPLYTIEKYQIVNLLTNAKMGDGYTEIAEANLGDRMLIKATRIAMNGQKLTALVNPDGSVVLPADYELIDLTDHYAVVADQDGQQGVFSLEEERFIVPCGYHSIVPCATDFDKYVHNGYVCVKKNGKLGFYDTVHDVESCKPLYDKRAVTNIGCTLVFTTLEGVLSVIAADGEINTVDADEILATRGNGYLLEAQKSGSFGLIDWHGNIILPLDHYKEIIVTDDSRAIIRTSTGLQLDTITR